VKKVIVKKSRKELWLWRIIFLVIAVSFFSNRFSEKKNEIKEDCIIRTKIYGEIFYEDDVLRKINDLQENSNVKGVLLQVDSPGGTITGSEALYKALKELRSQKPLVVSVQNAAASGGYMVAMAADKIFAYETSAVGSIGVFIDGFEVTELAEKIGVKFWNYKSSPLKGIPNMFEKTTEEGNKSIQEFINEMQSIFKDMVHQSRPNIPKENIDLICNGEAYSGRQAFKNGLIDGIGGEKEAMSALKEKVTGNLPVNDYELYDPNEKDSMFSILKNLATIALKSQITK
jgi:protease-4